MTPAAELLTAFAALPDLARRQFDADQILTFEGAGHIVHDLPVRADGRSVSLASRPWRLDPIPYVIDGDEFGMLRAGVIARMTMFESILADLYGARRLVAERVVDSNALWSSPRYRVAAISAERPKRWLTNYAVDVMRDVHGVWHVIADRTDAPSGVGYALLDRLVIARTHRDIATRVRHTDGLQTLTPFVDRLRDGLADLSAVPSPRIVMMSGGVDHDSFVEQSFLATQLGINLAEGVDLVVRQRRLWLRSLAGFEPVDVLFRRLEDDRIDPMEVNTEGGAGVPGLLLATTSGSVRLANAHGTGVIEDPELAERWDEVGEWLDATPSTDNDRRLLRHLPASRRSEVQWERQPTYDGASVLDRPVILRMHAVATDHGIEVLPGSSARPLALNDDPTNSTLARAKDMWVLGTAAPSGVGRRRPLPQVDLVASVPTRAAEALFWAGRALERTELVARTLRVVLDRTGGTTDSDRGAAWVAPAIGMLGYVAGVQNTATIDAAASNTIESNGLVPTASLAAAAQALASQLGSLLAEVSSVREFFSVTAGRVFARLADQRRDIGALVAATIGGGGHRGPTFDGLAPNLAADLEAGLLDSGLLDAVLIDIASLSGLWNESMVRGPAWRIGEIGRRLERAFGMIDTWRGMGPQAAVLAPEDVQHLIEIVLATNESLVAYRRRYRSDVEFGAAARLVVTDAANPRSAAASIDAVVAEVTRLGWTEGVELATVTAMRLAHADMATPETVDRALNALYDGCDTLARDLVRRYLASPVDPLAMGATR